MKRLIAVLLVMGVIMAAFAANGTEGKMNVTITPTKTKITMDVILCSFINFIYLSLLNNNIIQ